MKTDKIIELGTTLGLTFNRKDNYEHMLEKNYVVFNGSNGQRFSFDGNELNKKEIIREMGKALILYGMRLKTMHINNVLTITGDSTELPYHLTNDDE